MPDNGGSSSASNREHDDTSDDVESVPVEMVTKGPPPRALFSTIAMIQLDSNTEDDAFQKIGKICRHARIMHMVGNLFT